MEEWVILLKNRIIARFTISEGQTLVIGRGREADVVIHNTAVSRQHSSLELKSGQYYLADLHSMNGTRVNGKKIRSATPINKTDELSIGKFNLQPAKNLKDLIDEETIRPAASMGSDLADADMTCYVSNIYDKTNLGKKKSDPKNRGLTVLEGLASPTKLALKGKTVNVGKDPSCDLILSGLFLGKIQFTLTFRPEGYFIAHVGGLRQTRLNDAKLTTTKLLKPMDIIQVGGIRIRFT
jgi:pSer/pThr/pTyr-binding forkhead associated (FHA) protein